MGRRYRRRNKSPASILIRDFVYIGNRLPWWWAAIMGMFLFIVFYYLLPIWLINHFEANSSDSMFASAWLQVVEYRVHWVEYLGIALGLIGLFFAIKNYFYASNINRSAETGVGFFARLLARFFN